MAEVQQGADQSRAERGDEMKQPQRQPLPGQQQAQTDQSRHGDDDDEPGAVGGGTDDRQGEQAEHGAAEKQQGGAPRAKARRTPTTQGVIAGPLRSQGSAA